MADRLFTLITPGAAFRCVVVWMPETAEILFRQHLPSPEMGQYLVNLAMSALMLASGEKGRGAISLKIESKGLIEHLASDATPEGGVRAMISKASIRDEEEGRRLKLPLLGPGTLSVIRRSAGGEASYTGIVDLLSAHFGPLLTHYFLSSQQVRSSAAVATYFAESRIIRACGFLVQALPELKEADLARMEKNVVGIGDFESFVETLNRPEELMEEILGGFEWQILKEVPVAFQCPCDEERVLKAIAAAGEREVRTLLARRESLEVFCDYCRKRYEIPPQSLEGLLRPGTA